MKRDGLFQKLEILLAVESIILLALMVMQPVQPVQSPPAAHHGGAVAPVIHPMSRVLPC